MAFRDDMIALVDPLRRELIDVQFGLRLETVIIRRRAFTGKVGRAPYIDTDVVVDPKPRVVRPTPKVKEAEPGKYEDGDLVVDRISATYTEEELSGQIPGASELMWIVADEPYRVQGTQEGYLGWTVHLRRMRNR